MKKIVCSLVAVLLLLFVCESAFAQRPDGDREAGPRDGEAGRNRGFRPPPNPFMEALDTDKDGEISADEIKNASKTLMTLDKNKDGKLTEDEVRPPRPSFGGRGGDQGRGGQDMVARMMGMDKDKDGKISKDELPEFLQERLMERADTNKDGFLDKAEIEGMSAGRGRPDGSGRPGNGDKPEEKSDRPARPE